jgi:hypothetical protein
MQQTPRSDNEHPIPLLSYSLIPLFIAAYTLVSSVAVFFIVRGIGPIAGLILGDGVITAALSQLGNARVSVPVWIPLCGAAVVCAIKAPLVNRIGSALVTFLSVVILLSAIIAAFLLATVNGVFVHVAIGIIKMLLESGMF